LSTPLANPIKIPPMTSFLLSQAFLLIASLIGL
jgi:hypothetical protein